LMKVVGRAGSTAIVAVHPTLGGYYLRAEETAPLLFTENETNCERVFGQPNRDPYVKDGINDYVVGGLREAVNPKPTGTKAALHYHLTVPASETRIIRLRLTSEQRPNAAGGRQAGAFQDFDSVLAARRRETDEFYDLITPNTLSADEANVLRQALAGMLWSKQDYAYDITPWLQGQGAYPVTPPIKRISERKPQWFHLANDNPTPLPHHWGYTSDR